jgi:hypothetical protein
VAVAPHHRSLIGDVPRSNPGSFAKVCWIVPPSWGGGDIIAEHAKIYLGIGTAGWVAAMFTTLAVFLIAGVLVLGVMVDSLWDASSGADFRFPSHAPYAKIYSKN